jgi:hypothetical protein
VSHPALVIELDAQHWKSFRDYADALRAALGSPEGHGSSVDAFIDSMVYGGMNEVNPPYTIIIKNTKGLSQEILAEIEALKNSLPKPGAESNAGADIFFEIIP